MCRFSLIKEIQTVYTSSGEVMMISFFNFLQYGTTNKKRHSNTMQKKIKKSWNAVESNHSVYNNAHPRTTQLVRETLTDLIEKCFNILRTAQIIPIVISTFLMT